MQLKLIKGRFAEPGEVAVTIRSGSKWRDWHSRNADGLNFHSTVELWECPQSHKGDCNELSCTFRGMGKIIGVLFGTLDSIPRTILYMETDPYKQTLDGLKNCLEDMGFPATDKVWVTAIIYRRLSSGD